MGWAPSSARLAEGWIDIVYAEVLMEKDLCAQHPPAH